MRDHITHIIDPSNHQGTCRALLFSIGCTASRLPLLQSHGACFVIPLRFTVWGRWACHRLLLNAGPRCLPWFSPSFYYLSSARPFCCSRLTYCPSFLLHRSCSCFGLRHVSWLRSFAWPFSCFSLIWFVRTSDPSLLRFVHNWWLNKMRSTFFGFLGCGHQIHFSRLLIVFAQRFFGFPLVSCGLFLWLLSGSA